MCCSLQSHISRLLRLSYPCLCTYTCKLALTCIQTRFKIGYGLLDYEYGGVRNGSRSVGGLKWRSGKEADRDS